VSEKMTSMIVELSTRFEMLLIPKNEAPVEIDGQSKMTVFEF